MSVYQLLKQDHKKVKKLIKEMLRRPDNVGDKFAEMKSELLVHMDAEERHLYPPLRESEAYREEALEAVEEHHAARLLLDELNAAGGRDDRWFAKLQVFSEILDHHIEEEETAVFSGLRRTLTAAQTQEIQARIESMKTASLAGVV